MWKVKTIISYVFFVEEVGGVMATGLGVVLQADGREFTCSYKVVSSI